MSSKGELVRAAKVLAGALTSEGGLGYDADKTLPDGLYEIAHSIDYLAHAIQDLAEAVSDDGEEGDPPRRDRKAGKIRQYG